MTLRAAIVLAFGLAAAGESAAQYYYPPPPPYYPPPYRGGPIAEDDEQQPAYEAPGPHARRAPSPYPTYELPPPPGYERQVTPLPADPRYERPVPPASLRAPTTADPYERAPMPAPSARREEDPSLFPPAGFGRPPSDIPGRPPLEVAPGRPVEAPTGSTTRVAGLPPEYRPEEGRPKELPLQFRRQLVSYATKEPAGTIIIDTPNTLPLRA